MVFGALAIDAGLSAVEAMGFSAAIYAGASQLVILQLVALGTPLWSILVAVVALNFRHVLYSASLGRKLGRFTAGEKAMAFYLLVDPTFAAAEERAAHRPLTKRFYFAYAVTLYADWLAATYAGIVFGKLIGDQRAIGLDVLLPVYFLALTLGFRRRSGFLAVFATAALASVAVYLTLGSPWHVTLGGLAGILAAVVRAPAERTAP
ncbi:branched-chain amino acid ABC transporter permease [Aureimonas flava]|uniref:Branched-chain amino acid ABC transporter permease n=2 Tax=Aureimonas flava TaxID=2320271 RepID=A0A3A1WK53_9HYPH|nr:branched-chain amino acid ABC transporter permease [Aureimonas flava]